MLRILLLIIGLAAYGAYTLVEKATGVAPEELVETAAASESEGGGLGSIAFNAVANAAGLQSAPLPDTGCAENTINRDNLDRLLEKAPAAQREALMALMDKGGAALTIQWYSGDAGVGLCLPTQNKVVLLPGEVSQALSLLNPRQYR